MMDKDQIAAASRTISGHWRAGTKLGALDASQRPQSRKEGYAIQAELEKSGKLFGWKIAATSEAGQRHINVAGPMAGRILSQTVIADGGTASMHGNEMRVAEPEFYLLEIAAALAAELGTGAAHVMRRQLFKTHRARVVLNDLQHCPWREILTPDFAALAHGAKDLSLGNAGRGGPRVDRRLDPGRDWRGQFGEGAHPGYRVSTQYCV